MATNHKAAFVPTFRHQGFSEKTGDLRRRRAVAEMFCLLFKANSTMSITAVTDNVNCAKKSVEKDYPH